MVPSSAPSSFLTEVSLQTLGQCGQGSSFSKGCQHMPTYSSELEQRMIKLVVRQLAFEDVHQGLTELHVYQINLNLSHKLKMQKDQAAKSNWSPKQRAPRGCSTRHHTLLPSYTLVPKRTVNGHLPLLPQSAQEMSSSGFFSRFCSFVPRQKLQIGIGSATG